MPKKEMNQKEVLHQLATVMHLPTDHLDPLVQDVEDILEAAKDLQAVDTTNIEPTTQVTGLTNQFRADEVETASNQAALINCSAFPKVDGSPAIPRLF